MQEDIDLVEANAHGLKKSFKGIILAGGTGSRLFPMTKVISKQLLPIYDKPLIYYPLSVLLLAGIKDILIIAKAEEIPLYEKLFGNGNKLGLNIAYREQEYPRGIADAFIIGEEFIGDDNVCLILGDNVFYGQQLTEYLKCAMKLKNDDAFIFGYPVANPSEFGVVTFDNEGKAISIEEKPKNSKSKHAVPGIYFYTNEVVKIAKEIKPSSRGELEITSINQVYLENKKLNVILMGRGIAWLDTGTPEGMLSASSFIETIQSRQGLYVSCIEEIAWRKGFITKNELVELGNEMKSTNYGKYILTLCEV